MSKIDFKKELKNIYKPSAKKIEIVDVPEMNFLMIDGKGNPNTSKEFGNAVEALFSLAYKIKFMIKKGKEQIDYGVLPLEGLWWMDDMTKFTVENKEEWLWTVMIMQPDFIKNEIVEEARKKVKLKKSLPALDLVRFEKFNEGKVAQTLHIGPFTEEGPTIQRVHDFIKENGYELYGKHHEIYLSDIRKAAPENWKTIIRQPVVKR